MSGRPRLPESDDPEVNLRREQYRRSKAARYDTIRGTRLGHEYRRLAMERARLIAAGVDPADLLVPEALVQPTEEEG